SPRQPSGKNIIRWLLKKRTNGSVRYCQYTSDFGDFEHVSLTEEGQSRAISIKHGKNRSYELGASMQIATLNVHGPAQVGNGNTQNIHNVFNQLLQQIEKSSASDEEKQEAKKRLAKFLEHPLVGSIVGGLAGSLPGLMG
ncbi:hypothetical protein OP161_RS05645, partial [Escherichia coli]